MGILYTKMKIFHYPEKLASLSPDNEEILSPLHIRLKPTNVCNHNCKYCAYRKKDIQLGKDMVMKNQMPREKMEEIIDDFIDMGVKAITFSGGGEPLVYPYLPDALRKLSNHDIKFACLTNGSGLDGEIADIFARKGTWVRVSMDGWDSKSYASYRGVSENEFDKVMNNMERFKKLNGKCYLGVVIIVDKKNAFHVYSMIKKLKAIGIDSVKVSPCIISNNTKESNNYHKAHFEMVKEQINRAISDFWSSDFEIFNSYHKQLVSFKKKYTWCPYTQIRPVIGADLNVYSCQDKAYNLENGRLFSIKTKSFKEAWLSDKSHFFKINPERNCTHHCVADENNKMILEYLNADEEHLPFV